MASVNGCNLPEDLYYLIEKHVWAKPLEDGTLRVGMTAVAAKLAGSKLPDPEALLNINSVSWFF